MAETLQSGGGSRPQSCLFPGVSPFPVAIPPASQALWPNLVICLVNSYSSSRIQLQGHLFLGAFLASPGGIRRPLWPLRTSHTSQHSSQDTLGTCLMTSCLGVPLNGELHEGRAPASLIAYARCQAAFKKKSVHEASEREVPGCPQIVPHWPSNLSENGRLPHFVPREAPQQLLDPSFPRITCFCFPFPGAQGFKEAEEGLGFSESGLYIWGASQGLSQRLTKLH